MPRVHRRSVSPGGHSQGRITVPTRAIGEEDSQAIRLMISDAYPLFRRGIRSVTLQAGGFDIVGEAGDGSSTLELAVCCGPDLLILDFALPDIPGLEVLRRLRELGTSTKILFLTQSLDRRQALAAVQLGAVGIVTRDTLPETLIRALRTVMRGEHWFGRQTMLEWMQQAGDRQLPKLTLTAREREIIEPVVSGYTNLEIAGKLGVSEETIKTHVSNIFRKIGVSNRVELTAYVSSGKLKDPA